MAGTSATRGVSAAFDDDDDHGMASGGQQLAEKDGAYAMGSVVPSLPPMTSGVGGGGYYGGGAAAAAAAGGAAAAYYNTGAQQQQQAYGAAVGTAGIADGKMAKVKQGFVRSMDDELGEYNPSRLSCLPSSTLILGPGSDSTGRQPVRCASLR